MSYLRCIDIDGQHVEALCCHIVDTVDHCTGVCTRQSSYSLLYILTAYKLIRNRMHSIQNQKCVAIFVIAIYLEMSKNCINIERLSTLTLNNYQNQNIIILIVGYNL